MSERPGESGGLSSGDPLGGGSDRPAPPQHESGLPGYTSPAPPGAGGPVAPGLRAATPTCSAATCSPAGGARGRAGHRRPHHRRRRAGALPAARRRRPERRHRRRRRRARRRGRSCGSCCVAIVGAALRAGADGAHQRPDARRAWPPGIRVVRADGRADRRSASRCCARSSSRRCSSASPARSPSGSPRCSTTCGRCGTRRTARCTTSSCRLARSLESACGRAATAARLGGASGGRPRSRSIWSRPGPTPTSAIGTPTKSAMKAR